VLFLDLGRVDVSDTIEMIVDQPFVVLPRVSEQMFVPAPEEIQ
jgi:hypothetical protein